MGHRHGVYPTPLPTWHLTDRGCSPSPVWINLSLPPYMDAMDGTLSIDPGTHHDNVGNRALTPFARSKIFSQTIGERKGASRAPF